MSAYPVAQNNPKRPTCVLKPDTVYYANVLRVSEVPAKGCFGSQDDNGQWRSLWRKKQAFGKPVGSSWHGGNESVSSRRHYRFLEV